MYFGGISPAAQDLCAKHCDVFLMWPETEDRIAATMREMSDRAAGYGRLIDFGFRAHVIVRETEAEARVCKSIDLTNGVLSILDPDMPMALCWQQAHPRVGSGIAPGYAVIGGKPYLSLIPLIHSQRVRLDADHQI